MQNIINEKSINEILQKSEKVSKEEILEIINKGQKKEGLSVEETAKLLYFKDPLLMDELFRVSGLIKKEIYGERLVFFAPLYLSDFCINNCTYCNFHAANSLIRRKQLTLDEIEEQTKIIINMGHKRILAECGEHPEKNTIDYVVEAIKKIYDTRTPKGNIRRINVNIAATTVENYKKLKQAGIGTYQLFQETYHSETYKKIHCGPKADYERQITAHTRAYEAGIDDVGLGVLFGLYDWRFEILGLIAHAKYLDKTFGVGPHTISVPRIRKAKTVSFNDDYLVSDDDFLRIIAVIRMAVPYTGMIISTRERPVIRQKAFKIGISQASAASNTATGGYGKTDTQPQFEVQDERTLSEMIEDIIDDGFLPSFCTACYRLGRTGHDFMAISKAGNIHNFCRPNGLLTFAEYLEDFKHNEKVYLKGQKLIDFYLSQIEDEKLKNDTENFLLMIKQGKKDLYF